MASEDAAREYMKKLLPEIVSQLPGNFILTSCEMERCLGLDGFMSEIYLLRLSSGHIRRLLIAKFMRGSREFRENSQSFIQFANEVYVYKTVLPAFRDVLKDAKIETPNVDDWVARSLVHKFGFLEGLCKMDDEQSSVLVLEHLTDLGYASGPRPYLDKNHLQLMCEMIGQYHSISYGLRIINPNKLDNLKAGIIPLPFINKNDPNDAKKNLYRILYRLAFDRFFEYFDRNIKSLIANSTPENGDGKLIERLFRLKNKYFEEPTQLLERLRTQIDENEEDKNFGAILHGDYNRNNVLFSYKPLDVPLQFVVDKVKMIDFQELRYGTPAIDLSFCMYFNSKDEERDTIWMELLQKYHSSMYETLEKIVKGNESGAGEGAGAGAGAASIGLDAYTFEKFNAHFSRYAFYGCLICMHFLPWMLAKSEDAEQLSASFEADMYSPKFRKLSLEVGGDEVNERILNVLRHSCRMGYMDYL